MGNLADELDQLDDEEEYEDDLLMEDEESKAEQEAVRDSGIDVSYMESNGLTESKQPMNTTETEDDRLPPGLDDALNDLARLCNTSKTDTGQDMILNLTRSLQDLGNQSATESGVHRLNTSINSISSHLEKETKALQALSTTFLPPFSLSYTFDGDMVDEVLAYLDNLLTDLPIPDTSLLISLQRLTLETDNVVGTLAALLDTLQMGKQASNSAARYLRSTQTAVAEMNRERHRADEARTALSVSDAEVKIQTHWAAQQCNDIMSGFSSVCDALQSDLTKTAQAGA